MSFPLTQPALPSGGWLSELRPAWQWTLLVLGSLGLSLLLSHAGVPAAMLLGPMVVGIALTGCGGTVRIHRHAFGLAQGIMGCVIAKMLPLQIFGEIGGHWPVFATGVLSVIVLSYGLGLVMMRMRMLPGSTALWGLSPGAATAMVVMAESYGADAQLVALMQYMRVVVVMVVAAVVTRLWGIAPQHVAASVEWFAPVDAMALAATLAVALTGPLAVRLLRLPAAGMLAPLCVGMLLSHAGLLTLELPHWLVAVTYAVAGWRIGLRFTRPLLAYAARLLPRITASAIVLVALCGGMALALVFMAGIDPLTAYLATSPGGADSVAVIAASSNVDAAFVMAMQMGRFLTLLVIGPALASLVARWAPEA